LHSGYEFKGAGNQVFQGDADMAQKIEQRNPKFVSRFFGHCSRDFVSMLIAVHRERKI